MRETVKRNKENSVQRILFNPQNAEERAYLQKLTDLLSQKRHGDWVLVAEIMELPSRKQQSAEKAFLRVYSKHHFKAVEALEKVINNRKNLIKIDI